MLENQLTVKCPNCKDNLVKSHNNEVKMRVLMMKWNEQGCFAVCKSCKCDVEVDFEVLKKLNTFFTYEAKKG